MPCNKTQGEILPDSAQCYLCRPKSFARRKSRFVSAVNEHQIWRPMINKNSFGIHDYWIEVHIPLVFFAKWQVSCCYPKSLQLTSNIEQQRLENDVTCLPIRFATFHCLIASFQARLWKRGGGGGAGGGNDVPQFKMWIHVSSSLTLLWFIHRVTHILVPAGGTEQGSRFESHL